MTESLVIGSAVDDLRLLIAKADAFSSAAEDLFDEIEPDDHAEARRHRERLAHLIGAAASAVQEALQACDELAMGVRTRVRQ